MYEDLDARLEFVVPPSLEIVDPLRSTRRSQAGRVRAGNRGPCARSSAFGQADVDAKANFARVVAHNLQSDVMRLDHRAIMRRAIDGDFELARQEREFGVERRPLP